MSKTGGFSTFKSRLEQSPLKKQGISQDFVSVNHVTRFVCCWFPCKNCFFIHQAYRKRIQNVVYLADRVFFFCWPTSKLPKNLQVPLLHHNIIGHLGLHLPKNHRHKSALVTRPWLVKPKLTPNYQNHPTPPTQTWKRTAKKHIETRIFPNNSTTPNTGNNNLHCPTIPKKNHQQNFLQEHLIWCSTPS